MTKSKVEVKGLKIYCEKLDKEIMVDIKNCFWDSGQSECEVCGSHGNVSVDFKCECGKDHEVELKSW